MTAKKKAAPKQVTTEMRLTPEDVNKALTQYVSGLFIGRWEAKVLHVHKTGGATVALKYAGITPVITTPPMHSGNFTAPDPANTTLREPILQRDLEKGDILEGEMMDEMSQGKGEMVEL